MDGRIFLAAAYLIITHRNTSRIITKGKPTFQEGAQPPPSRKMLLPELHLSTNYLKIGGKVLWIVSP